MTADDMKILRKLTEIPGPSGSESAVQEYYLELMAPYVDNQYSDRVGNCYHEIYGSKSKRRIMFNAHSDTIGFMVKYIDDQGFVFTEDIGGSPVADPRMLPGTAVNIISRHTGELVPGHFIPIIPYHLVDEEDELHQAVIADRAEMAIDIGVRTQEEAEKILSIGDYVLMRPHFEVLNKRVFASGLDDRLCMFVMYKIAKALHKTDRSKKNTVVFASTVGEEGMLAAAGVSVSSADPDVAITLDVMPATDSIVHDADFEVFKQFGMIKLNDGPVLARGLGISDSVFMALEETCTGMYQIELSKMDTDAQFIHSAGRGVKTGLVMIPVRNAHTQIETVDLKDVDSVIKLCKNFIRNIDSGKCSI